jgi:hypothetical protein
MCGVRFFCRVATVSVICSLPCVVLQAEMVFVAFRAPYHTTNTMGNARCADGQKLCQQSFIEVKIITSYLDDEPCLALGSSNF